MKSILLMKTAAMELRITVTYILVLYKVDHGIYVMPYILSPCFFFYLIVFWQDIMVLFLHMVRQAVAKPLLLQEEQNVTVTEASFPGLYLIFLINCRRYGTLFLVYF